MPSWHLLDISTFQYGGRFCRTALEFRRRYPAPALVSEQAMIGSVQKILILGGYGTFGRRLAQLLADDSRLTLVIAGRSLAKAQKL
jgi:hypothetical protein